MKHIQDFIQNSTVADRHNLENNIQDLEAQLVKLREELGASEERHQKQLTASGAIHSALEQVLNVLNICESISEPGLADAFWSEIQDIKSGDYHFVPALKSADSDSTDSNSPNSPDLDSMKLSQIKEYANSIGISAKTVKDDYGNLRSKSSWISAIDDHNRRNQITTKTNVNETIKSEDSSDETNNNHNVITVESKGVSSHNSNIQVSSHANLENGPIIDTKVDSHMDGSDTLVPYNEKKNDFEHELETDLATQDDEYFETMTDSKELFNQWDSDDNDVQNNSELDWNVSFDEDKNTSSNPSLAEWGDF
jgi:hypothetical protein